MKVYKGKRYFHRLTDNRGAHIKYFVNHEDIKIDEVYCTINHKNTLRGLHSSLNQTKFIQVLAGSIRLVILENEEFTILDNVTNTTPAIHIPVGVWVGYLAKEDNTIVNYIVNGEYNKENDLSLSPLSYDVNKIWGIKKEDIDKINISEKDLNAPPIFENFF